MSRFRIRTVDAIGLLILEEQSGTEWEPRAQKFEIETQWERSSKDTVFKSALDDLKRFHNIGADEKIEELPDEEAAIILFSVDRSAR